MCSMLPKTCPVSNSLTSIHLWRDLDHAGRLGEPHHAPRLERALVWPQPISHRDQVPKEHAMFRLKSALMTATLLGSLFGFANGPLAAQTAPVAPAIPVAQQSPEQRVALVIGNSNYRNAPQ